jgi:hypothetical protein
MPAKKKATPDKVYINNNLPIIYVDALNTSRRTDGFNYLSFATSTPSGLVEQVRLMIEDESLRTLLDDICQTINYFPKKSRKEQKSPSK